jgi:hypothetical protein
MRSGSPTTNCWGLFRVFEMDIPYKSYKDCELLPECLTAEERCLKHFLRTLGKLEPPCAAYLFLVGVIPSDISIKSLLSCKEYFASCQ